MKDIDTLETERLEIVRAEVDETPDPFIPAKLARPIDPEKEELLIRVEL